MIDDGDASQQVIKKVNVRSKKTIYQTSVLCYNMVKPYKNGDDCFAEKSPRKVL